VLILERIDVGVGVAVGLGVPVAVGLGVAVAVGLGVAVAVGLGVGVGVSATTVLPLGPTVPSIVVALAAFG
jgi:hypothetical protein